MSPYSDDVLVQDEISLELPKDGPRRRTAISTSNIEYVDLNANPILGCSHACRYCYARKIDVKYERVNSEEEWHDPKVFSNFLQVLKREIETGKIDPDKEIFLSTMTDLYQPMSIKLDIPRRLILMLQEAGLKYRILTKSHRIVEDKEILDYERGKVGLSITTNSTNEKVRKYWEPKTPNIKSRLLALQELAEYGDIPLWVSAEPFLPGTDFKQYYKEILVFGKDNLNELILGKMNHADPKLDREFNWEEIVRITEKFRKLNKDKIRFHYKREFWKYLQRINATPVDLNIAPSSDFCYQNSKEIVSNFFDKLPREDIPDQQNELSTYF